MQGILRGSVSVSTRQKQLHAVKLKVLEENGFMKPNLTSAENMRHTRCSQEAIKVISDQISNTSEEQASFHSEASHAILHLMHASIV